MKPIPLEPRPAIGTLTGAQMLQRPGFYYWYGKEFARNCAEWLVQSNGKGGFDWIHMSGSLWRVTPRYNGKAALADMDRNYKVNTFAFATRPTPNPKRRLLCTA